MKRERERERETETERDRERAPDLASVCSICLQCTFKHDLENNTAHYCCLKLGFYC